MLRKEMQNEQVSPYVISRAAHSYTRPMVP